MRRGLALLLFCSLTIPICGAAWSVTSGYSLSIGSYSGSQLYTSKTLTVSRGSATGSISYFYILISGAGVDGSFAPDTRRTYAGSSATANSLQIYIRRSTSVATEIGSTNAAGTYVLGGSISSSSSSKSVTIYFYTGMGVVPAATYTNTFSYQVYTTDTLKPYDASYFLSSTSLSPVATGTMTLNVTSTTSASSFSMSLSPTSVDFGSMVPDSAPSRDVILSVMAPANYAIAAKSTNNGYLVLAGETTTLSYHIVYGSSIFYLTGGIVEILKSSTSTGGTTVNYTLTLELDPVEMQEPGTYTDNLWFTFTTQ